jgi:LEA14-like dessication related protein
VKSGLQRLGQCIAVIAVAVSSLVLADCAALQVRDPLNVTVAGIEPIQGEGMEVRFLMNLRMQNPNDTPFEYNGVALELKVSGKTFATGVSNVGGSVPRFAEILIPVPVTVSAFSMVAQALEMIRGDHNGPISYEMKGKLNLSDSSTARFRSKGELPLPAMGPISAER